MSKMPGISEIDVVIVVMTYLLYAVGLYGCFVRSGKKGWLALIPIVNWVLLLDIVRIKKRYIFLIILPLLNLVAFFWWHMCIVRACGYKGWVLILLILFMPLALLLAGFGTHPYDLEAMLKMKARVKAFCLDVLLHYIMLEASKSSTASRYWYMTRGMGNSRRKKF